MKNNLNKPVVDAKDADKIRLRSQEYDFYHRLSIMRHPNWERGERSGVFPMRMRTIRRPLHSAFMVRRGLKLCQFFGFIWICVYVHSKSKL